MHNFILHSIKDKGWMPLYYYPANEEVISADNVACFFKEKGWRWVAGENKDGSPMPSTDTGLLQYNSFDWQGEWVGSELWSGEEDPSSPLVAEVDLLAVQHGTE